MQNGKQMKKQIQCYTKLQIAFRIVSMKNLYIIDYEKWESGTLIRYRILQNHQLPTLKEWHKKDCCPQK